MMLFVLVSGQNSSRSLLIQEDFLPQCNFGC
jgi:hypothetical protein